MSAVAFVEEFELVTVQAWVVLNLDLTDSLG
jgi:hypothetical protein